MPVHPVILSGGSGTRLWPESLAAHPKQFLPLTSRRSLLQETALRVADAAAFAPALAMCNRRHRFLVAEQLREVAIEPDRIVLEPAARNTAPAIAAAAMLLAARDRDALMLVLPSDHAVGNAAAFRAAVATAMPAAAAGLLVTFGVEPTGPHTGYGYIAAGEELRSSPGCFRVSRFVEKPDLETARRYLAKGGWSWNSGMFLFAAGAFLDECKRWQPALHDAVQAAIAGARDDLARDDLDFLRLAAEPFAAAPSISVDYAVMERTGKAAVVPADMDWTDMGSWAALWQTGARDEDDNFRRGRTVVSGTSRSLISSTASDGPLVVALGVERLAVVATRDAVLVAPLARADEVGDMARRLGEEPGAIGAYARVHRPWGFFQTLHRGERFQVKRLSVKPGAALSLQRHRHRAEHWVVLDGVARVVRDGDSFLLRQNEVADIPPLCVHRLANPGPEPLDLIEVQTGSYLGEDDIERFEDDYGRSARPAPRPSPAGRKSAAARHLPGVPPPGSAGVSPANGPKARQRTVPHRQAPPPATRSH